MKYFCKIVIIISFFIITSFASAQSNDITMMGKTLPLYLLEKPFSDSLLTSENENVIAEIDNIVVENNRILIRIFFRNLTQSWKDKITDDDRLYGSYLPIAEIVLDDGSILTPSSASKYSFLEYNNHLIIGGLLSFDTDKKPQSFYLNINQIPFDTKPLSEGFSKAVILKAGNSPDSEIDITMTPNDNGLEFSLTAAAQTNSLTMLQPSVRINRSDEILSKFGWITISDSVTGRRYAVTRGNLYGFNLTDDSVYSPAHSYVFAAQHTQDPLEITMDHAYVVRNITPVQNAVLDLNSNENIVLLDTDDFHLEVYDIDYLPEEDRIRIYIDSGEKKIADISFIFKDISGVFSPSVNCGFAPENNRFACDFFYNDISFPVDFINIEIDAIEYLMNGPWTISWVPVSMPEEETPIHSGISTQFPFQYSDPYKKDQPDEIKMIQDSMNIRDIEMTSQSGWIRESYDINYSFGDSYHQELIPIDQYDQFYTHYISETLHLIDNNQQIIRTISLIRDPENKQILSAQSRTDGNTLDLVHALSADTNQPLNKEYKCFSDFQTLIESSAVFVSETKCGEPYDGQKCLEFYQSLNGLADSPNAQIITFRFDNVNNFLLSESISYGSGALNLQKETLILENTQELPEDLIALMDSIQ